MNIKGFDKDLKCRGFQYTPEQAEYYYKKLCERKKSLEDIK